MATLSDTLRDTRDRLARAGLESPRREAEALLCGVLGLERSALLAHPDRALGTGEGEAVRTAAERRAHREPLAYILGVREFWSLPLAVTPEVLIPRPSTEHLIEVVLERVDAGSAPRVLDVGTGSGAIVVALAHELPRASFVATDVSAAALTVARRNVASYGLEWRVRLRRGDLFGALVRAEDGPFDVIVANPPYVPERDVAHLMPDVREFEPVGALASGAGGLDALRRLVAGAGRWLVAGGWLALEHGSGQAEAVAAMLREAGFAEMASREDYEGHERVAVARWPRSGAGTEAG